MEPPFFHPLDPCSRFVFGRVLISLLTWASIANNSLVLVKKYTSLVVVPVEHFYSPCWFPQVLHCRFYRPGEEQGFERLPFASYRIIPHPGFLRKTPNTRGILLLLTMSAKTTYQRFKVPGTKLEIGPKTVMKLLRI
jgi:hypothetical protein